MIMYYVNILHMQMHIATNTTVPCIISIANIVGECNEMSSITIELYYVL